MIPLEGSRMNDAVLSKISLLFGAFALIFLVADLALTPINRALQAEVAQRQAVIADGQSLNRLNQGLVRAMAEASLKNNDLDLRDLLSSQGITLKSEPIPALAASAAPAADKKK
jgi:hypothetical protein